MYSGKCAITQLRVITSTSYSGANMRTTPTSATQNVFYGNAGYLATELNNWLYDQLGHVL